MDSDSEIFITQNTFRNEKTENQSDGEETALDFDAMFPSMSVSPVPKAPKWTLEVSDISDDEMLAATLAVENAEASTSTKNARRYGEPVRDDEMANMTRRR